MSIMNLVPEKRQTQKGKMRKSLHSTVCVSAMIAVVSFGFTGCRQAGGCQNGSCPAPSGGYSSPSYGGPSNQGSATVSPSYSAPSQEYAAPGGSGTRSAPVMSGSGTR
ncbi:hypothetical protein Pla52n_18530 [Stieleria varia]|uniref:Uncharacterized protein n=1 Tax=Stieleria varia TaxID=2528005 RepID=A0A5C6B1X1_9BACT|nr:hypothetical protein Pla52n_18530 [Stieleria varia]